MKQRDYIHRFFQGNSFSKKCDGENQPNVTKSRTTKHFLRLKNNNKKGTRMVRKLYNLDLAIFRFRFNFQMLIIIVKLH